MIYGLRMTVFCVLSWVDLPQNLRTCLCRMLVAELSANFRHFKSEACDEMK